MLRKIELKFLSLSLFSSRPGRPPKRSLGMPMQDGSRLLPHSVHGLLSPSLLSPTGTITALCVYSYFIYSFLFLFPYSLIALSTLQCFSCSYLVLVLFLFCSLSPTFSFSHPNVFTLHSISLHLAG